MRLLALGGRARLSGLASPRALGTAPRTPAPGAVLRLAVLAAFVWGCGGTELVGVRNFRRVSARLPDVYRSAAPETLTALDVESLKRLRVHCVIDLRNQDEITKARAKATPEGLELAGCLDAGGFGNMRREHIPVLNDMDSFWDSVESQLPPLRKAESIVYRALDGERLNQLLYSALSEGGNAKLNTAMLEASAAAFGRALRATAAAIASGDGVLLHCAYGKDRTGVLAALLQLAVGDSDAEIVDAYGLSEKILGPRTFLAETRSEQAEGADLTNLQGSPPEAMASTLKWLQSRPGGVNGYLASTGCTDEWRAQLLAGRAS
ncbi:protein-tyrosine phosphatase-like protein [Pavlovales sp. CCMP2436]|nr:protein-tyrosine phosphatase-like protein [Pavlovales sp. CCMP2436]|mmetsp:Transcript_13408/g.31419  ORF Transcript_13408/g.31419 Transcript_13408/m.31419 type:complete len:321 (-) Transcript_13408:239-1201(-)